MSEALERLKDIGAQKIYEDTHIPVEHVQAILYESFDGLHKVQFMGFVSILEREYGEDLSAVRSRGIGYFDEKSSSDESIVDDTFFKAPSNKKKQNVIFILLAILLLAIAIFYTMRSAKENMVVTPKEQIVMKKPQQQINLEVNASDENKSKDRNISVVDDDNITTQDELQKPKAVVESFKIVARKKVWLGYIDVATDQKDQKTFQGTFSLDPQKEWLLYLGHGYIDININGAVEKFSDKNALRLHYLNGKVSKIDRKTFKKLNRGNAW